MPTWDGFVKSGRPWGLAVSLLGMAGAVHADQAREVRMGVYQNEPKIFLNDQQQASGIFGDLAREIAQQENWTLVPVACEWKTCRTAAST